MRTLMMFLLLAPSLANAQSSAGAGRTTTTSSSARLTAIEATIVVKVVHPEKARRGILELVEKRGGFPALVTDHQLVLKVPPKALSESMRLIADMGLVLDKSLKRSDVTEQIAKLEGSLRSKSQILAKLRSFFDDSNVQATLQIERNMTSLVAELEQVKGKLRVQREKAAWSRIEVNFRFRRRETINQVTSPFDWINTVSLERFLEDF